VPKDFDQVTTDTSKHVKIAGMRLCGAPHNPFYVSRVIMWRRDPDTANRAAMTNIAAT
jgi:hypothetical protein